MNKINIDIPITGEYATYDNLLTEAEKLPKSTRQQFTKALETVKKNLSKEQVYFVSTGAFDGTTFGYLFITKKKAILAEVTQTEKFEAHEYKYDDYKEMEHDKVKVLDVTTSVIELKRSGLFGGKSNKITNIPLDDFDDIYKFIKMQMNLNETEKPKK